MTDNPYATPGALTVFRRAAMASDFEAAFNESADEDVADAALDALDEVDRVEEALSVFRPTSAVSRLNLLGAEMSVRVDDELWNWIETSIRLGEETDGAFDVASAPLWRVWGFANRDGEFPKEEDRLR
ncbi:MAG: FAD:protein FMN transferase, partial [Thermoguttaceae bacterium]|nr:FAD:protein FMN transferase [Thermoguttaceae bacterium]